MLCRTQKEEKNPDREKEPDPQHLYDILHKKYEREILEKCWKGCIETDLYTDTDGLARNKMI